MNMSQAPSPGDQLFAMSIGCRNNQLLYVVAKLGIADLLVNGPLDCNVLARKLSLHARSLFRVMRALAAQGIFTQDSSNRFGLTPTSQLLRSDNPETFRYVSIFQGEEYYRAAGGLLHTVKTGETAFDHIYGKGHFDYLGVNPEASSTFNHAMIWLSGRFGNPLEKYQFRDGSLVVDVGGGRGGLIANVLRSNPTVNGMLYDLPQGVAEAEAHLKSLGVADRCRIVTGSFFDAVPSGGDVYMMSRVLHDWPDEKARLILANCRKAISGDGKLLIREAIIPEGDTPSVGKQTDITMLFMLGGAERTEQEWRRLLEDSDFRLARVIKTGQPFDVIEAA